MQRFTKRKAFDVLILLELEVLVYFQHADLLLYYADGFIYKLCLHCIGAQERTAVGWERRYRTGGIVAVPDTELGLSCARWQSVTCNSTGKCPTPIERCRAMATGLRCWSATSEALWRPSSSPTGQGTCPPTTA
jgi:hypothetical protein